MRDSNRLFLLKQLITNNVITSQYQLMELMAKHGYSITQSSLSRDLTAIHAEKMTNASGQKAYVIMHAGRYLRIPRQVPMQLEEKRWIVMYVRMYHEKKVVEQLKAKGIECWIPLQWVKRKWSDRIKTLEVLAITKTVFIHCTDMQRKDTFCLETLGFLMDHDIRKPAVIPDNQMHTFMRVIEKSQEPVEFTEEMLQPGEPVLITSGQFAGAQAELCKYHGTQKVIVRLGGLGSAFMTVNLSDLAPIKK